MLLEANDKEFAKTNGIHTIWVQVNERGEENGRKIFPSSTKKEFQHIRAKGLRLFRHSVELSNSY